jgi:hypothetical protein
MYSASIALIFVQMLSRSHLELLRSKFGRLLARSCFSVKLYATTTTHTQGLARSFERFQPPKNFLSTALFIHGTVQQRIFGANPVQNICFVLVKDHQREEASHDGERGGSCFTAQVEIDAGRRQDTVQ